MIFENIVIPPKIFDLRFIIAPGALIAEIKYRHFTLQSYNLIMAIKKFCSSQNFYLLAINYYLSGYVFNPEL
jgi:hypothetical protein